MSNEKTYGWVFRTDCLGLQQMETGLRQTNTLLFPLVLQARSEAAPQAAPLQSAPIVILHQPCRSEGAISAGDLRLRLPYTFYYVFKTVVKTTYNKLQYSFCTASSSNRFCRRTLKQSAPVVIPGKQGRSERPNRRR
jgi:hypothetical protein